MLKAWLFRDGEALTFSPKEKFLYVFLSFYMLAVYAPGISWLYNVAMWLVFVYSFFYNTPAEKWQLLRKRPALLLMMLFFLLNCISAVFSANQKEGLSWVGIRISLLAFPLALGSIYLGRLKDRLVLSYAMATTIAAAFCVVRAGCNAVRQHDSSLLYNDNLSAVIHLQSVYFAVLINIAVFSYIYLLQQKSPLVKKYAVLPLFILLAAVHFLLASRMGVLFLYGSLLVYAVYSIVQQKRWMFGIVLAISLVATGILLVYIFPKTVNRFRELGYTKYNFSSQAKESHFNMELTPAQWNGANIRLAIWQSAWTVARKNLMTGTGLGDKMDELKKQYAINGFEFGIRNNRNAHSNYLDVLMSMGLIAFVVFIIGFVLLPARHCLLQPDWYGLAIVMSFTFAMIPETYMDRTAGNTFLAFFLSFVAAYKLPPAAY
jgi:O-antigen ligase